MTTLARRDVLKSGALALGALAVPYRLPAETLRRLVIVRLHGGADGLSMVAPWADAGYRRARPTVALGPPGSGASAALDLDGTFGLHPRLAPLRGLFAEGALDILPACGLETVTGSHLADAEALDRRLASLGAADGERTGARLHSQLTALAACVTDGTAPAVAIVHSEGWDHHAGQRHTEGPLATALDDLARGLASFARDLGPHLERTTLVTVSEFGRAVRENGLGGTEHGHATAVFVLGGGVRRGRILGAPPRLEAGQGVSPTVRLEDVLRPGHGCARVPAGLSSHT